MRVWPFQKAVSDPTDDAVVAAIIEAGLTGASITSELVQAAELAVENLFAAKFGMLEVSGAPELSKAMLACGGRAVARDGCWRLHITVQGGQVRLERPVRAERIGEGWRLHFVRGTRHLSTPAMDHEVINFVWRENPLRPWDGKPLTASTTSQLAQNLDCVMRDEAGGPSGTFTWIPGGRINDAKARRKYAQQVRRIFDFTGKNRGRFKAVHGQAFQKDTPQGIQRVGPNWPDSLERTRGQLFKEVAASAGVMPELISGTNGAVVREAARQFSMTMTVIASQLSETLGASLGRSVNVDASKIGRADLVMRSRALGSLVKAGVPINEAREICELETQRGD